MVKRIVCISIMLFIVIFAVSAGGKKEKDLIIPSDAGWVLGLEVAAALDTSAGNSILDKVVPGLLAGEKAGGGMAEINQELEEALGLRLENISGITIFGLSQDPDEENPPVGIIINLKDLPPGEVIKRMEAKTPARMLQYKDREYYQFQQDGEDFLVHTLKERLLVTDNREIMEKMLAVNAGKDDIEKNKALFRLIRQHRENMIYFVGFIPDEMLTDAPELLAGIKDIGISVSLTDKIIIKATLNGGNPKDAENLANFIKLTMAMAGQFMPEDSQAVSRILQQLLAPIVVNVDKSDVVIDIIYTEQDLEALGLLLPAFTRSILLPGAAGI